MIQFIPILAEVADKEPSLTAIWGSAAFFCLIGFLLQRWCRVAGFAVLPLAGAWAWAIFQELHDAYVGPAILQELGRGYVAQAYIAAMVPFILVTVGFWKKRNASTRNIR